MVKPAIRIADDPERALVLRYAPPAARAGLAALLALDDRLGAEVRRGREPALAQLRLAWWAEALTALDGAPPPPEPILQALAREVLPLRVEGVWLAGMIDGWELLLGDEPLDDTALGAFATARGGRLFAAAATLLGRADGRIQALGEGWALADPARRWREPVAAAWAAAMALERLDGAFARRWPAELRPLGALALLARSDLNGGTPGAPSRIARLFWHRLTGF